MKKYGKIFLNAVLMLALSAAFMFAPMSQLTAFAMSANISFSDPNGTAGQEFDVRMKVSATEGNLGSANILLAYDPNFIQFVSGDNAEGGAGTLKVSGQTTAGSEWVYNFKFKAVQAGSTSITITDSEIYDGDSKEVTLDHQGSSSITIVAGTGASSNANLSALKISPGVLEPAFSPDVFEYKTVVGGSCDKIVVSAPAADANAKVIISGNDGLQLGENTITADVTAEDGSTQTYKIAVTKQEGEVSYSGGDKIITANVGGVDYEVVQTWDSSIAPENFTIEEIDYHGDNVQAAVQAERGLTLLYLIGSDGSGDFFVYDTVSDEFSPYAQINVAEKSVTIVPLPWDVEVPEGFEETTLELNGKKVQGWIWATDADQKYCIVYGMNADGERDFYRYDMKEKTIQRYFRDPALHTETQEPELVETANEYNDLLNDYNIRGYILLGVSVIAVILLIALIALLIINRKSRGDDGGDGRRAERRAPERKAPDRRPREGRAIERQPRQNRQKERDEEDDGYEDLKLDDDEPQRPQPQPAPQPAQRMTAEERYLRGVESDRAEEAAVMEQLADDHERMVRDKIAREVEATTRAARRNDDDFEDVEL